MSIDLVLIGLVQGLILALVAYAVMIPFRLLNFPDLTSEGAYPLGGAIGASILLAGFPPVVAIFLSALAGGLAGIVTGLIHLRLKVNTLLAGIIVATMVYSVNLRVMGKPNIALFGTDTIFGSDTTGQTILLLCLTLVLLVAPLFFLLHTEVGLRLRAVGLNPDFAKRQGIPVAQYTLLGLFLAGGYAGMGGSLMVQVQSYMDIGMGVGIVLHALAALMIGESIIGNTTLRRQLLAPLIGALVYQQIQGLALAFGLEPSDLKFFTGAMVLLVIATKKKKPF